MAGWRSNPVEPWSGVVLSGDGEGSPRQLLRVETVGANLGIVLAFWQSPGAPRILTGKLIPEATLIVVVNGKLSYGRHLVWQNHTLITTQMFAKVVWGTSYYDTASLFDVSSTFFLQEPLQDWFWWYQFERRIFKGTCQTCCSSSKIQPIISE